MIKIKRLIKKSDFNLDINSPEELLIWMNKNIHYGYMKKNKRIYKENIDSYEDGYHFFKEYCLQSPEELFKNKYGVCWDQAEFQRFIFNKLNIENYVIYMIQNNEDYSTHSYSIFKRNNKFFWFENSWESYRGIHGPFKSIEEISKLVHDNAIKEDQENDNGYDSGILQQPPYGLSCIEYMTFAKESINSKIDFNYSYS